MLEKRYGESEEGGGSGGEERGVGRRQWREVEGSGGMKGWREWRDGGMEG
jgi:hypothetical protein